MNIVNSVNAANTMYATDMMSLAPTAASSGTAGKLCAVCLVALFALILLRQWKPEWAPLLRLSAAAACFGALLSMTVSILTETSSLCGDAMPTEAWKLLLKALGIAFLTELSASVCRDSGEGSLAFFVETAGKLEILLLSFPLIRTVLETALTLLSQ